MSRQEYHSKKKDVNDLHSEFMHPLEKITKVMGKVIGFMVTGTFKAYEDCVLGRAKNTKRLLHIQLWKVGDCSLILNPQLLPVWMEKDIGVLSQKTMLIMSGIIYLKKI